jgi:succinate dehydrogenase / fumarate reductase iron-sulfur subunit
MCATCKSIVSQMFNHLKRVHAWLSWTAVTTSVPGRAWTQEDVMERYAYSRCMTLRLLSRSLSAVRRDHYIGPQAIAQVRLFNMHPSAQWIAMSGSRR